ncbi:MAG TPA: hypothetical protein VKZ49_04855 [Polyangiaceae bacterium]|nr:hypothetical protein [Polyangiaceae bacterium]
MRRRARRVFLASLLAALPVACLSPTLPLPPPGRPEVEGPTAEGQVTLTGSVKPRAHVQAANLRAGRSWGQFTGDDGRYTLVIEAQIGDEVVLWYSVGNDSSPSTVFTIRAPD